MRIAIFAGSKSDRDHVECIKNLLKNSKHSPEITIHYLSAHKFTREVLTEVGKYQTPTIFITVAGRSNALSGVVAANTIYPVIACPVFKTTEDYMIDIHSTLRMPSQVPVLTVLSPDNCALAVERIIELHESGI